MLAEEPWTPENRAKALRYVELLESTPEGEEAKEALGWLTIWLVEVPDITVVACLDLLGPDRKRESIPAPLLMHHVYAQASYLIRNPDAKPRSAEVLLAGVEGTLRNYEARVAASPDLSFPLLDELLKKRDRGELRRYVSKRSRSCR